MKVYKLFALLLTFATAWGSHLSAKVIDVKSPNGELNLSVDVKDKIYYSVSYGNDLLLKDCISTSNWRMKHSVIIPSSAVPKKESLTKV